MAKRSRGRKVDGILVLDKPTGMSSNQALQRAKRLFSAAKAGHTGALDPLATGVLPLCLGEATKLSQYLLDSDKAYRTTVTLGVATSTADSDGDVLSQLPVPDLDRTAIEATLANFRGEIQQTPPAYSALKQDGVPLYKLARAGKPIKDKTRSVTIQRLELLDWHSPALTLEVWCSKGTYIRTLAEDIGKALGCGGHVSMLRRIQAGPFGLADCVSLEALEAAAGQGEAALDALLRPADQALAEVPAQTLDKDQATRLCQGQQVLLPEQPDAELLRLYSAEGFLGLGSLAEGRLKALRLVSQVQ